MFKGRERELRELNRLYQRGTFQLFILYGRRRVGKTTLLKEFCRDKNSIFFSAEQSNEKMNLDKFSELIFRHFGESTLEPFSSFENALLYIYEKTKEEPLVLVIDEFPYLAAVNSSLLSLLQHMIDHRLQQGKLFMVLCGSYMGFMEKEVLGNKSPLFGRRTAQLHLRSFDYRTSCEFLEGFTDEEKLMLYGAYGGTALYLRQVDAQLSLKENIQNSFLRPTAYLYEEPLLLLRQEVQEPGVYSAIIEAIAGGASRANEIATKTGEPAAKCLKYIASLCELGIIDRQTPFGEKVSSRKSIYRISDFMFRFWYRYVSGNKTLLETDALELVWKQKIEPDYSHYMGLVFEQVCRDYLLRKNSLGELPILFTEIGSWWGTDRNSPEHGQAEVDLVARGEDDFLFGECKWKNQPLDYAVLERLRHRADLISRRRNKTWFALFSKTGFTDAVLQEAAKDTSVLLFDLKDIMSGNL